MIGRRNKKRKKTKTSLKLRSAGKMQRRKNARPTLSLKSVSTTSLAILVSICAVGGIVLGLSHLNRYVKGKGTVPGRLGSLELIAVSSWVNEELQAKVYAAACADRSALKLNERTARIVHDNVTRKVAWLDEVRVQVTHNAIQISSVWRQPLALVRRGVKKCYLDAELVVLDYVPMPELPVVEVAGLPLTAKAPPPGSVWQRQDLAAAVEILRQLHRCDNLFAPEKPLRYELASIDISNFGGRKSSSAAHIVLYAKDKTQIIWGAEYGQWHHHLESTDEEKLNRLYSYYREYGSLAGNAKYINLRDPQDYIPLPIDRY